MSRLLQLVADYGPGELAFAELLQRLGLVLPDAEVRATRVPPGDTLAAGFCVARLALGDGPADRLVVHDVVARSASPSADLLCFARGPDGVAVIGPNHGWSWSFVVDEVCGPCYLEVPASTPAGRNPELLAAAVVRIARRQPHALRGPVPRAEVAPLPRRAVAYVDGDGNLVTTMAQLPAALGSRLRIRIGCVSVPARVAALGDRLPDDELVLRPVSSGWALRGGGRRSLVELHLPGGTAAARFDDPPIGAPIAVEPVGVGVDRPSARPARATDKEKGRKR